MQVCTKCNVNKTEECFCFRNKSKGTRSTVCKNCQNAYAKQYREQNIDKLKEKQSIWYNSKGKTWKETYDKENASKIRDRDNNRYQFDLEFRIKKVLRTRFSKLVKLNKRSQTMIKYLDMDIELFKHWIECQFDDTMCWGNYGTVWDFDHVMPCKAFDLTSEDDVALCYRWNNLRPLVKRENYQKSAKIDNDTICKHQLIADTFVRNNPGTKAIWKQVAGVE
jgi:hypothetical protein